ncbi:adenylate/guanylate cyclase domain-containing protein [Acidimicrobiaceae bacterium AH-315-P05]|nr:adenylate/guanylate cyclase domain-containing protein [Acidimicrobiaceae bacterium AH-315-P05]
MSTTQGPVTFLFTDVEGSTRRWEDAPGPMRTALQIHDELLGVAFAECRGEVFATGGDGFAVAFADPSDAVTAAARAQRALEEAPWPDDMRLRVRMGIHTGLAEARDGDFFGPTLNRAARLMAAGHGDQILMSEATRALLGGDPADTVDLGRHRLKDITDPQRIYQYGSGRFDALRTIGEELGNLRRERTSFIGRDGLIDEITAALSDGPLVTLVGVGGVGKTRTALRVARAFATAATDGAWWCPLSDAQTPDDALDVIASSLGVRVDPGDEPIDAIVRWLSTRQILLVLDNCEHVLDAIAEFAEEVLDRAPGVLLLATSREGLSVAGERLFAVPSLLMRGSDSESVELFVSRARDVRADFDPAGSLNEIAEICRRLDGIPLAIELAAARVFALSPHDILGHLDRRFDLLTGGRGRRRERHQTLRQAVQWSYDYLDDTEQAVFRRLSVFAGDFDLAAAVSVGRSFAMTEFAVVDALGSLCRKSLVETEATANGQRYRYLETVRAFAEEANESAGELDAAMEAMTTWFVLWAGEMRPIILDCRLDEVFDLVELEETNLRRMLSWAAEHGDTAAIGRFFTPVSPFEFWGGDSLAPLAAEFVATPGLDDAPGADRVFALAAFVAYEQLDYEAGAALTDAGLANAAAHGAPGYGCRIVRWALDFVIAGDEAGADWLLDARDIARSRGDASEEGYFEVAVYMHHAVLGDVEYVDAHADAVRRRVEATGSPMFEMVFELWNGWLEVNRDLDAAKAHLLRAMDIDGHSRSFIGTVVRQQLAAIAILDADDATAVRIGASLARHGHDGGRSNWISLGAVALTGPLVKAGDAAFAAELLGFASTLALFDNVWVNERAHATDRVRDAVPAETFDRRFAAGKELTAEEISNRVVSRLSVVEALVDTSPNEPN